MLTYCQSVIWSVLVHMGHTFHMFPQAPVKPAPVKAAAPESSSEDSSSEDEAPPCKKPKAGPLYFSYITVSSL